MIKTTPAKFPPNSARNPGSIVQDSVGTLIMVVDVQMVQTTNNLVTEQNVVTSHLSTPPMLIKKLVFENKPLGVSYSNGCLNPRSIFLNKFLNVAASQALKVAAKQKSKANFLFSEGSGSRRVDFLIFKHLWQGTFFLKPIIS